MKWLLKKPSINIHLSDHLREQRLQRKHASKSSKTKGLALYVPTSSTEVALPQRNMHMIVADGTHYLH